MQVSATVTQCAGGCWGHGAVSHWSSGHLLEHCMNNIGCMEHCYPLPNKEIPHLYNIGHVISEHYYLILLKILNLRNKSGSDAGAKITLECQGECVVSR